MVPRVRKVIPRAIQCSEPSYRNGLAASYQVHSLQRERADDPLTDKLQFSRNNFGRLILYWVPNERPLSIKNSLRAASRAPYGIHASHVGDAEDMGQTRDAFYD